MVILTFGTSCSLAKSAEAYLELVDILNKCHLQVEISDKLTVFLESVIY